MNPLPQRQGIARLLLLAVLASCAPVVSTARGVAAEVQLQDSLSAPAAALPWNLHFAIGDFDGDSQPDVATVQSGIDRSETRYWIHLEFSTGVHDGIGVSAPSGGLHIASRDVNGDHFLDLVVTTAWQHTPVAVLLNDGHGKFTLHDPALFPDAALDGELSWNLAPHNVADAFAAILTRNFSVSWDICDRTPHELLAREFLVSDDSSGSRRFSAVSIFGRGPPSNIPHV